MNTVLLTSGFLSDSALLCHWVYDGKNLKRITNIAPVYPVSRRRNNTI